MMGLTTISYELVQDFSHQQYVGLIGGKLATKNHRLKTVSSFHLVFEKNRQIHRAESSGFLEKSEKIGFTHILRVIVWG